MQMYRKRILFFTIIILLTIVGCVTTQTTKGSKETAQIDKQSIVLTTEDDENIFATFYPTSSPNAAGVILLPDARCDRALFDDFPSNLNKAGFAVLSMDLRFKDLIAQARSKEEVIDIIKRQDLYASIKYDIKSALGFLTKQQGVDPGRIALIGTSVGARLALLSGVKYKIKALVLVSLSGQEALPGSKPIKSLLEEYGTRPILFMTSEKDWGGNYKAAQDNKQYFNWAKGKKDLKIWPGSGHGITIVNNDEASDFIVLWLKNSL